MIYGSGTVCHGTVTVWENPTRGLPVLNPKDIEDTPRQYRYRLVKPTGTVTRPEREDGEDLCLAGYVTINWVKAYTLFDSGSTTDAVSPDFTRVSNVPILRLDKPATLQLGCSGSRSKINFATIAVVEFGSTTAKIYLDIANLDKYDCILGTPFLRKHGISLDFQFQEIVICGKLHIPALPEGEGTSVTKPIQCGKWLHGQGQQAEESLTHVEPSKLWWNPITIEEVEDDDIHKINAMNKLDDDKQILFKHQNKKETRQHQDIPQEKPKDKLPEGPSYYRKWFECKNAPKMTERGILTLHSDNYKYKGPFLKEEVLLAAMDANINELKKGDEDLPELYKKWVEAAANILTGAPLQLPPLREVNHKIPIIDENKRYV